MKKFRWAIILLAIVLFGYVLIAWRVLRPDSNLLLRVEKLRVDYARDSGSPKLDLILLNLAVEAKSLSP